MSEKTYNGWTNYETWNVALWMGNDEGSSNYWDEAAQECWDESKDGGNKYIEGRKNRAQSMLADRMKDYHEEVMADILEEARQSASMWADLLGGALSEVDWHEIADTYLDNVDKDDEEEEEEEDPSDPSEEEQEAAGE